MKWSTRLFSEVFARRRAVIGTAALGTVLGLAAQAVHAQTGSKPAGGARPPGPLPLGPLFNPLDYGAVADGTTDNTAAFAAMMSAVYATKGGTIWLPPTGGSRFGRGAGTFHFSGGPGGTANAWTIDPGRLGDNSGTIRVELNGNWFSYSGSGWFLQIKSNIAGPNNVRGQGKNIIINGGRGNVLGSPAGKGGVLWQDQVQGWYESFQCSGFTRGTGHQLEVTNTDTALSCCETNTWQNLWSTSNLVGFYGKAPLERGVPQQSASFEGNVFTNLVAETAELSDACLFKLEGAWASSVLQQVGGFYGHTSTKGCVGFILDGYFEGVTILSPRIDSYGSMTSSHATDWTFGKQYTKDPHGFPTIVSPTFTRLPENYWQKLNVVGFGCAMMPAWYEKEFVTRALYVGAHAHTPAAGSLVADIGTLSGGTMWSLDHAGSTKFRSLLVNNANGEGLGYATGAGVGGMAVQATSKATRVTLNKLSGFITMNNAALAAGAKVSFAVSNATVAATDVPVVVVARGGTANGYRAEVTAVEDRGFTITVENLTDRSLSEQPVISFSVLKGAAN